MSNGPENNIALLGNLLKDLANAFAVENVEEILDVGINFSYISVLSCLRDLNEPAMSELGHASCIQLSTLTRMVDRLVELNLVERKSDPSDRRIVRVKPTDEGLEVLRVFAVAYNRRMESVLKHLTGEERQQLVGLLQKVHGRVFKEREGRT